MKKIYNKIGSLMLIAVMGLSSCTKSFEELNTDPNNAHSVNPEFLLSYAQKKAMDNTWDTWQNGRFGMLYAQYWAQPSYTEESRYQIRTSTNYNLWAAYYHDVLNNLEESIRQNELDPQAYSKNQIAIAKILKGWAFHVLTDIYGDIPYNEALKGEAILNPPYESSQSIYLDLLKTLNEQIAVLDDSEPGFGSGDNIYGGDISSWKKFANSLIVRIALRMVDKEPAVAQAAIEEAVVSGVFESNADNALYTYLSNAPNNNPINEAYKTRGGDFAVSKSLVDYLQEINDPRLSIFAAPVGGTTNYVGQVYGVAANGGVSGVSLPGTRLRGAEDPGVFMNYSEVAFALAECAERGFSVGGTAEDFYKKGISSSMEFWRVTDDAAISAYIAANPYNSSDWKNVIGIQKWLAMYMQGIQGWLERIRLDIKKPGGASLFAAPADGSLDQNVQFVPYRMTYPVEEQTRNAVNYKDAVSKIPGGVDSKGAKQWWMSY